MTVFCSSRRFPSKCIFAIVTEALFLETEISIARQRKAPDHPGARSKGEKEEEKGTSPELSRRQFGSSVPGN